MPVGGVPFADLLQLPQAQPKLQPCPHGAEIVPQRPGKRLTRGRLAHYAAQGFERFDEPAAQQVQIQKLPVGFLVRPHGQSGGIHRPGLFPLLAADVPQCRIVFKQRRRMDGKSAQTGFHEGEQPIGAIALRGDLHGGQQQDGQRFGGDVRPLIPVKRDILAAQGSLQRAAIALRLAHDHSKVPGAAAGLAQLTAQLAGDGGTFGVNVCAGRQQDARRFGRRHGERGKRLSLQPAERGHGGTVIFGKPARCGTAHTGFTCRAQQALRRADDGGKQPEAAGLIMERRGAEGDGDGGGMRHQRFQHRHLLRRKALKAVRIYGGAFDERRARQLLCQQVECLERVEIAALLQGVIGFKDQRQLLRLLPEQAVAGLRTGAPERRRADGALAALREQTAQRIRKCAAADLTAVQLQVVGDGLERLTDQQCARGVVEPLSRQPAQFLGDGLGKARKAQHTDIGRFFRPHAEEQGTFGFKRRLLRHEQNGQNGGAGFRQCRKLFVDACGFSGTGSADI